MVSRSWRAVWLYSTARTPLPVDQCLRLGHHLVMRCWRPGIFHRFMDLGADPGVVSLPVDGSMGPVHTLMVNRGRGEQQRVVAGSDAG